MAGTTIIPWAKPEFWGNEKKYVASAVDTTWISGGEYVERFESEFAACSGARFTVSTSNGTTAIHLAFLALGLGPGDEVVVPGFSFMAAANIAMQMGAKPVFTEVDPDTWCMKATEIEKCLSARTKIVIPVHIYGNVCDMTDIIDLAENRGFIVVEDAAEAFLSKYDNRFAGTMGEIGCFSFQATKTITTGEGGMVVTGNTTLHRQMVLYRNHGMRAKRYWHEVPGHNFRLTNLQAALGCAQMEGIDRIIRERKRVHAKYMDCLASVAGITLQHFEPTVDPVLWAMALKLDPRAFPQGRDRVMEQIYHQKIETRPGFYAASRLGIYESPSLPVSETIGDQVISLPTFPSLADEQIVAICNELERLKR